MLLCIETEVAIAAVQFSPATRNTSRHINSMSTAAKPIIIATRGSALALAQANLVFDQCRAAFPKLKFEIKIIQTTGDKLQTASLAKPAESLPKGLFTKELEVALLRHRADLAVHSLKDLPSELPAGLTLGAMSKTRRCSRRADLSRRRATPRDRPLYGEVVMRRSQTHPRYGFARDRWQAVM